MTEGQDGEEKSLNKTKSEPLEINKGFELMLRHRNRRGNQRRPKTFHIMFGKVVSLWSERYVCILSSVLTSKKQSNLGEGSWK